MDSRWNNVSVMELWALMADNPELQREQLLLEVMLKALPTSLGTEESGAQKKRYRLEELINSHRREAKRRG